MGGKTTVLLMINGYGITENIEDSAFDNADMPVLRDIAQKYPYTKLLSSGIAVGLPNGQPGNAMVGCNNIGAGRIVYQDLSRINKDISRGSFFGNKVLLDTLSFCKKNDSGLHIMGLLSDGGVHSHMDHLFALLKLASQNGLNKVYVHCFMDGRDTPVNSGISYIEMLQSKMREYEVGEIASVSGRYYAMDRDNNYERIKLVYTALTRGEGNKAANAAGAVQSAYESGLSDEYIKPTVIVNGGVPVGTINDEDAVIFFNFRPDRAKELTKAFCDDEFRMFKKEERLNIKFVCFTDCDESIENKDVIYGREYAVNNLGEYLSLCSKRQLRLTESETASYVTSFFDGLKQDDTYDGEDKLILRSLKNIESYSEAPLMNCEAVCKRLVSEIEGGKYDFILCSLANADIVGHSGDFEATVKACEALDRCIGKILSAIVDNNGVLFICSTHGKAEKLREDKTKEPYSAHTVNPVPVIMVNYEEDYYLREIGCLADIAPTILQTMQLQKPKEMTGKSLLIKMDREPE
ncbi:MAG: 2,3-bisphosphoglycerate-independent phosphoglycerate mutase [Lachnospiraceae bacterium]|nr:2,3-bisphosphoglycerate-independent phosphoglycerate mutase [Lachnospiraceae bacterium]